MGRRRVLACLAVVAGLTVVQAAPAFADGSAGSVLASTGEATSSSGSGTGGGSETAGQASTDEAPSSPDPATTVPAEAHDQAPAVGGPDAPTSPPSTPAEKDTGTAQDPSTKVSDKASTKARAANAPAAKATSTTSEPADAPRASATSAPSTGTDRAASRPSRVTPLADPASPLTVTLAAVLIDLDGDGRQGAGDAVDLTATVQTAGPSDVSALVVAPVAAAGAASPPVFSCPVTTVTTGAEVTCTLRQQLTQVDVDAGHVTVVVTASGTVVDTGTSTTSAPATLETPVTGTGSLTLSQSITQRSDADHDGRLDVGDLVDVTLTARNTGTLTLSGLVVGDALLSRLHVAVTCSATRLAPGASTTCRSARFAVTRAQATAKVLRNQATASARTPAGATVKSATSTASVAVQAPATRPSRPATPSAVARLGISQWVASVSDHDGDGRLDAGDTVTFGFRVTNTGTVSVHGLRVVDRRLARAGVGVHCPASTLGSGASVVCMSGPVTIVAWQAKKGFGRNFAYATASTAAGTSVRSNSSVAEVGRTTPTVQAAALPRTGSDLGDPALLGLALLLGGATMTVMSRRRPARRTA
jgi:hypothetical protein